MKRNVVVTPECCIHLKIGLHFSAFSVKKKPSACKPGSVSSVFESPEEENECSSPKKGNKLLETNSQMPSWLMALVTWFYSFKKLRENGSCDCLLIDLGF